MSAAAASAAASAAAAAERQRRRREEEEMTPYTSDELDQNWEFKIMHSAWGAFRKPEFLQRVLDDEARAGWVLIEKFDNNRIRLKRPEQARQRDGKLDFDPYRTEVVTRLSAATLLTACRVAVVLGVAAAILGMVGLLATWFG